MSNSPSNVADQLTRLNLKLKELCAEKEAVNQQRKLLLLPYLLDCAMRDIPSEDAHGYKKTFLEHVTEAPSFNIYTEEGKHGTCITTFTIGYKWDGENIWITKRYDSYHDTPHIELNSTQVVDEDDLDELDKLDKFKNSEHLAIILMSFYNEDISYISEYYIYNDAERAALKAAA